MEKKILNLKNIRGTKLKFGNFQEEKKNHQKWKYLKKCKKKLNIKNQGNKILGILAIFGERAPKFMKKKSWKQIHEKIITIFKFSTPLIYVPLS